MADAEKPSVLIIGGLGYIGRFLARYIHDSNLASEVRLVDKVLPQLAWLAPEFEEACGSNKFMQADASKERTYLSSAINRVSHIGIRLVLRRAYFYRSTIENI
jgi:nucleoside-diphosphate-sugar epimerase